MKKDTTKRMNFTLPESLLEKIRKEAYKKRAVKGYIIRQALIEYFEKIS